MGAVMGDAVPARAATPEGEEWRRVPISPYRNYEVSSLGRVRRGGKVLSPVSDGQGYLTIKLSYAGLAKRFKIHRLVCEAFHGPCPEGMECGHRNGISGDNRSENLRWITRSQNTLDQIAHGTFVRPFPPPELMRRGIANTSAKLNEAQVRDIRRRASQGESGRSLAREFGLSSTCMSRIIRGERWAHVN